MAVEYDLVGGGSGGLLLLRSCLAEKRGANRARSPGGDCLWYGCVPSNPLSMPPAWPTRLNQLGAGIHCNDAQIDFAKAIGHVQVSSLHQPHDSAERFESLGVEVILAVVNL